MSDCRRVTLRIDRDDPSPNELRGYFARIFATLDECPRPTLLKVCVANDRNACVSVDVREGNPVFRIEGRGEAPADFRGRWLPEHPVPLVFPSRRPDFLMLEPTSGNRVRIRRITGLRRLMLLIAARVKSI